MKLKRLVYYNTKKTEMQIFNHELPVDAKEKNERSLKMVDISTILECGQKTPARTLQ